jgi:hypothetical protein
MDLRRKACAIVTRRASVRDAVIPAGLKKVAIREENEVVIHAVNERQKSERRFKTTNPYRHRLLLRSQKGLTRKPFKRSAFPQPP